MRYVAIDKVIDLLYAIDDISKLTMSPTIFDNSVDHSCDICPASRDNSSDFTPKKQIYSTVHLFIRLAPPLNNFRTPTVHNMNDISPNNRLPNDIKPERHISECDINTNDVNRNETLTRMT